MSASLIAFFNNKCGVGQTSLVYHLSWMFAEMGVRVIAADLDPQANLTAALVTEDRLEEIWDDERSARTTFGATHSLTQPPGEVPDPQLEPIADNLALLVGDTRLSLCEDPLAEAWRDAEQQDPGACRAMSAFDSILRQCAVVHSADVVLIDLAPTLSAVNRAALIATDHVVFPIAPDLLSLRGIGNLGSVLRSWREGWKRRRESCPGAEDPLPAGSMSPMGYVVHQHPLTLNRPDHAYNDRIRRIPSTYRTAVLGQILLEDVTVACDHHCLALIKSYPSLMLMAEEARKPAFMLKPADGAMGAHLQAARSAGQDYEKLARRLAKRAGIEV